MVEMPDKRYLHKMTSEELGKLFPVIIQDYSEEWAVLYNDEKTRIVERFEPTDIVGIEHIGSTAIPGIKAKPTIDILLQVSDCIDKSKLINSFISLDYQLNKRPDKPPPHMTFVKGYSPKGFEGQTFHVHIRYKGDWDEIRFRNYLISHKDLAKEYESLKIKMASIYRNDREAYTASKSAWIEKVNKLARE